MKLMCGFFLAVLLIVGFPARDAAAEPSLRIGVAEADITPPKGFPMAGYYHERLATGVRDPLKARAIVFVDGREKAAIVVCDLIGIAADLSAEVRRRAADRTGIPATHIVVSATHSHTAPDYTKNLYMHLRPSSGGIHGANEPYAAKLIDGIVAAIAKAHANARPAVVDAGSCRQKTPVSFNRRFVMKDGSVRTWMRLDSPDVVRAAGPIDPEIGMLLARSGDGKKPLALLSNFALHLDTVGGTMWSADYPHFIEERVRRSLGADAVSIFATGCCGDINHVDPVSKDRNKADFIGAALGKSMAEGLKGLERIKQPTLRVRHMRVAVPLQDVSADQVARARPLILDARAGKKVDFYDLVGAYKSILIDQLRHKKPHAKGTDYISWGLSHTWAGIGSDLPVDVQVIALGNDIGIVCLPGEVFVDLGLAIKRASPFKTTLVIELANCVETIYIPTRAAYAGGGYEVANAALKPGSGEMLVEAAVRLLREIATENVQTPKR